VRILEVILELWIIVAVLFFTWPLLFLVWLLATELKPVEPVDIAW